MSLNHTDEEADHDHTHEDGHSDPYVLDENHAPISEEHSHGGHSHETSGNVLVDAWEIFSDPAHFIAEIGFSLIIDFVIIFLGYQLFIKKLVIPRLRKQIHKELDQELNIDHAGGEKHDKS